MSDKRALLDELLAEWRRVMWRRQAVLASIDAIERLITSSLPPTTRQAND